MLIALYVILGISAYVFIATLVYYGAFALHKKLKPREYDSSHDLFGMIICICWPVTFAALIPGLIIGYLPYQGAARLAKKLPEWKKRREERKKNTPDMQELMSALNLEKEPEPSP